MECGAAPSNKAVGLQIDWSSFTYTSDSDIEVDQSMPKRLEAEGASVSENRQQVINARPVLIKALLIALLGGSRTLLCSLTDSRAERWGASTFHCYPAWERRLWCCRAAMQDSLWTVRETAADYWLLESNFLLEASVAPLWADLC